MVTKMCEIKLNHNPQNIYKLCTYTKNRVGEYQSINNQRKMPIPDDVNI